MQARSIAFSGRARSPAAALLLLGPIAGIAAPRAIPKDELSRVPLRDLALDAQYAEVRAALERYREPVDKAGAEGEARCRSCGEAAPEDHPRCSCGAFLHAHLVFTCPSCAKVVARDSRDCLRCGAAFWSPVNPPEHAVTESMVAEYLDGYSKMEIS